jgi:hypothetical protein
MHLKIVRKKDVEGENRGWNIDNLEFFIEDSSIGYISIENIPENNLKKFYPQGAYSYFDKILGYNVPDDIMDLTKDDFNQIMSRLIRHDAKRKTIRNVSYDKFSQYHKEKRIKYFNEKSLYWKNFLHFHVNRPFISYIRLYDYGEQRQYFLPKIIKTNSVGRNIQVTNRKNENRYFNNIENPSWRKKGLGYLLYLEGALFLDEQGLLLHKSKIITDEAQKTWKRIEDTFDCVNNKASKIEEDKDDIFIDIEKIKNRNYYPEWITNISIYNDTQLFMEIDNTSKNNLSI